MFNASAATSIGVVLIANDVVITPAVDEQRNLFRRRCELSGALVRQHQHYQTCSKVRPAKFSRCRSGVSSLSYSSVRRGNRFCSCSCLVPTRYTLSAWLEAPKAVGKNIKHGTVVLAISPTTIRADENWCSGATFFDKGHIHCNDVGTAIRGTGIAVKTALLAREPELLFLRSKPTC